MLYLRSGLVAHLNVRAEPLDCVLCFFGMRAAGQDFQILLVALIGLSQEVQLFLGHSQPVSGFGVSWLVQQGIIEPVESRTIVLYAQVVVSDFNIFIRAVRIPGQQRLVIRFRGRRRWLRQGCAAIKIDLRVDARTLAFLLGFGGGFGRLLRLLGVFRRLRLWLGLSLWLGSGRTLPRQNLRLIVLTTLRPAGLRIVQAQTK